MNKQVSRLFNNKKTGHTILVSLLIFTLFMTYTTDQWVKRDLKVHFQNQVEETVNELEQSLTIYMLSLEYQQSLFSMDSKLTYESWKRFVDKSLLFTKYPGVHVVSFARYVKGGDRKHFEEEMGRISPSSKIWPEGEREEYLLNQFVDPIPFMSVGVGYDHFTEPMRTAAATQARDQGKAVATQKITLITDQGEREPGFIVYLPVYQQNTRLDSDEKRKASWIGHVLGAFYVKPLIETSYIQNFLLGIDLKIFDGTLPSSYQPHQDPPLSSLLYHHQQDSEINGELSYLNEVKEIQVAGQSWTMVFTPTQSFSTGLGELAPSVTLVIGLLISLMTFFTLQAFRERRDQAEAIAKEMTRKLQEAVHFQAAILDTTEYMIISTDPSGIIRTFNRGAERYLHYTREEVIGTKTPLIFHDPSELMSRGGGIPVKDFSFFIKLLGQKDVIHEEWTYITKNGLPFPVQISITKLVNEEGKILGYLGIAYDITARRWFEAELKRARDQALEASNAKSEFLAAMSHEIRTPMNAIIGISELLAETDLTAEQHEYVGIFMHAGENLLHIINDILDLAKIESRQFELECIPFPLHELIEETISVYALSAHQKGLEFIYRIEEGVPTHVFGDPTRLRQVIANIVSNAVKFTDTGEILVDIRASQGKGKDSVDLELIVSDTGIGIPKDKWEVIFQDFTQVEASTTRRFGGTGLGLTLVRRLLDLMGGSVKVESELGKGSTFHVDLSLQVAQDQGSPLSIGLEILHGENILVVDDTPMNRFILKEMLQNFAARIDEAESGEQALACMKQHQYKLILLDCRMPGMDGFQLVERLKELNTHAELTVMMLTSDNRQGDMARAKQMGIATYLIKPIKRKDLFEAIACSLQSPPANNQVCISQSVKENAVAYLSGQKKEILLVEDNDDNRLLVMAFLKNGPYAVDYALNGEEAVERFKQKNYDLVLMDMQMPVKDGYAATREIRKWEQQSNLEGTPILALTAYALKDEEKKSFECGCNAHLTKPIKKKILLDAIEQFTKDRREQEKDEKHYSKN